MKPTANAAPLKPVTLEDVAEAVGLHKSSVSLVLSGKGNLSAATRERVEKVARELGYEPNPLAQRLANGSRNNVVYIFSGVLDVGLGTEKILLIQQELNRLSLEVPIYTCGETTGESGKSQAAQLKQLCRHRPRAVICAAHILDPTVFHVLEAYQSAGGIVISYDIPTPLKCDQVIFDREDNAYQAARHLLEHGHRRLGLGMSIPSGWSLDAPNKVQQLRLRGFKRALKEFGLNLREEWLFQNPTYERGGAAMAQQFLQLEDAPSGLCIVNDYVALGFMAEVIRAGLQVPQDVSIIGHDNQPVANYCPVPLTCISQPVEKIAHAVVEMLMERIKGSTRAPRTITIKGELVSRQSVATLR